MAQMRDERQYCVYILTNFKNNVLYVGVTNDLLRRVQEHRQGKHDGFTKKYKVWKLVHFEATSQVEGAIKREKQLKAGSRDDKIDLVKSTNPYWRDLYHCLLKGV
jgi:putative endonuclease